MISHSIVRRSATILSGAALSSAIECRNRKLVGIRQPADCEGTAWGLQGSFDGATYYPVYMAIQEATGAAPVTALWEVTKSATVAQLTMLGPRLSINAGFSFIKLQSQDGSNAAANQSTADATIEVLLEEVSDPSRALD